MLLDRMFGDEEPRRQRSLCGGGEGGAVGKRAEWLQGRQQMFGHVKRSTPAHPQTDDICDVVMFIPGIIFFSVCAFSGFISLWNQFWAYLSLHLRSLEASSFLTLSMMT